MSTETTSIRDMVAEFRVATRKHFPYLSRFIYELEPVEREGLGTMAVDKNARLYYDPEFVTQISVSEGAYVILHESWHLALRHCHRRDEIAGPSPNAEECEDYNIAVDIAVWLVLESIKDMAPFQDEIVTWPWAIDKYPTMTKSMSVAEYYSIIRAAREQKPDEVGPPSKEQGGDGPQGDSNEGTEPDDGGEQPRKMLGGGSAADGVKRDYEEDDKPEFSGYIEDRMLQQVEQDVADYESSGSHAGTVPGALKEVINEVLHPRPDPWKLLSDAAGSAGRQPNSLPDYTYRRLSRREYSMPDMPRMAGVKKRNSLVCIIIDTSGSIDKHMKIKALEVVSAGIKRCGGRQRVVVGDTEVCIDTEVADVSSMDLMGGGGTRMDVLIDYCEQKHKPTSIICVTDGWTPWPDRATKARLVVALTEDDMASKVPTWAKKIVLE